jgi:hypothetical protein
VNSLLALPRELYGPSLPIGTAPFSNSYGSGSINGNNAAESQLLKHAVVGFHGKPSLLSHAGSNPAHSHKLAIAGGNAYVEPMGSRSSELPHLLPLQAHSSAQICRLSGSHTSIPANGTQHYASRPGSYRTITSLTFARVAHRLGRFFEVMNG